MHLVKHLEIGYIILFECRCIHCDNFRRINRAGQDDIQMVQTLLKSGASQIVSLKDPHLLTRRLRGTLVLATSTAPPDLSSPDASSSGRCATVARKTKETSISVSVSLDGTGKCVCFFPVKYYCF